MAQLFGYADAEGLAEDTAVVADEYRENHRGEISEDTEVITRYLETLYWALMHIGGQIAMLRNGMKDEDVPHQVESTTGKKTL